MLLFMPLYVAAFACPPPCRRHLRFRCCCLRVADILPLPRALLTSLTLSAMLRDYSRRRARIPISLRFLITPPILSAFATAIICRLR